MDEKKLTSEASAAGGDAAAKGSAAGCAGVRAEAAETGCLECGRRRAPDSSFCSFGCYWAYEGAGEAARSPGTEGAP